MNAVLHVEQHVYLQKRRKAKKNVVSVRYPDQTWVPQCCGKVRPFQHCTAVSKYVNKPSHHRKKNDLSALYVWAADGALDMGYAWIVFLAAWQMQLPRFLSSVIVKALCFFWYNSLKPTQLKAETHVRATDPNNQIQCIQLKIIL